MATTAKIAKEDATRARMAADKSANKITPARVKIRYQDEAGARREIEADGLLAACLQHEIDHLDGIMFLDHLTPLKRNMLLRKLAKDLKQKAAG